jgi:4-amino-4-deoxy-L-arabinose transferase-like glycosyltransferase
MENQKSKHVTLLRQPILWIVLLGFVLRMVSMSVNYHQMRWQNDARMSIPATRILDGKGFTLQDGAGPTAYRPPLYILWLTFAYAIFGKFSTLGPSFMQIVVSTGNIVLLFLLTRQIWKRDDAANAAAFFLAVHPYTVYHDPALYHTFLSTSLLLGALLFLFKGIETKRAAHIFWSGLLFGLCVLILSTIVPFLGFLIISGLVAWKIALKRRFILIASFILGLTIGWGPWIVRNAIVFHRFIPLTTEAGVTLWVGNNPYAKNLLPKQEQESTPVPKGTAFNLPERYMGCSISECRGGISENDENRELTSLAIGWIKTNPKEFVMLTIWRYASIWSPFLTPAKTFFSSKILNIMVTYGYFLWNILFFVIFLFGARMAWREKKYFELLALLTLALSSTGGFALFQYYTKYRIPFETTLLSLAGAGGMIVYNKAFAYFSNAVRGLRAVKKT